jgi:GNAT superfamily N-acetyltransferase
MTTDCSLLTIRKFEEDDETALVSIWHRASVTGFPFLPLWQSFSHEQAREVFASTIKPHCDIWVAALDQRLVAYLAMKGTYIDRLFVDPVEWRKGWGTQLINFAKQISPEKLELHTHQENVGARALYEREGFRAVKFGISPPPECAPDVEYHWRSVKVS